MVTNTSVEFITSPRKTDGWLILKVVDGNRSIESTLWDRERRVVRTGIDELLKWDRRRQKRQMCEGERKHPNRQRNVAPLNLQEWMNTCHVPRRVTEYGRAADCFSKSGFASFPLVLLSNEEHSSPRGCEGGKWKKDKYIYFLWWHTKVKKIKQNKAFFRAWKGSIITPL